MIGVLRMTLQTAEKNLSVGKGVDLVYLIINEFSDNKPGRGRGCWGHSKAAFVLSTCGCLSVLDPFKCSSSSKDITLGMCLWYD